MTLLNRMGRHSPCKSFSIDGSNYAGIFLRYVSRPTPRLGAGSTCELREFKILIEDINKMAYLINAARLYPDGSVIQTFDAIFTIANISGDWRLVSRNPFNITKEIPVS